MKFSRVALAVLIAAAMGGAVVSYAAAPGPKVVGTSTFPISVKAGDYDLIAQVLDLPPGGAIPRHTHGGPVVVYMISGQITFTDANGSRTAKAGETFTENPGLVHSGANQGSVVARVAVSYLIPKGAAVTTFVK